MTHLNESIYGTGIASSYQSQKMKSGVWQNDDMLANVCKHNVTRFPYQISRFAQDIAGGLMVTLPSEAEHRNPITGPLLEKYLKGRKGVDVESRMRILRLIENMTMGSNTKLPKHMDKFFDNDEPNLIKLLNDKALPIDILSNILADDPIVNKPYKLQELPNLENDLTDKDEPKSKKSNTLIDDPILLYLLEVL
jgi:hypothetical protein